VWGLAQANPYGLPTQQQQQQAAQQAAYQMYQQQLLYAQQMQFYQMQLMQQQALQQQQQQQQQQQHSQVQPPPQPQQQQPTYVSQPSQSAAPASALALDKLGDLVAGMGLSSAVEKVPAQPAAADDDDFGNFAAAPTLPVPAIASSTAPAPVPMAPMLIPMAPGMAPMMFPGMPMMMPMMPMMVPPVVTAVPSPPAVANPANSAGAAAAVANSLPALPAIQPDADSDDFGDFSTATSTVRKPALVLPQTAAEKASIINSMFGDLGSDTPVLTPLGNLPNSIASNVGTKPTAAALMPQSLQSQQSSFQFGGGGVSLAVAPLASAPAASQVNVLVEDGSFIGL
jgi:hypothetical protein